MNKERPPLRGIQRPLSKPNQRPTSLAPLLQPTICEGQTTYRNSHRKPFSKHKPTSSTPRYGSAICGESIRKPKRWSCCSRSWHFLWIVRYVTVSVWAEQRSSDWKCKNLHILSESKCSNGHNKHRCSRQSNYTGHRWIGRQTEATEKRPLCRSKGACLCEDDDVVKNSPAQTLVGHFRVCKYISSCIAKKPKQPQRNITLQCINMFLITCPCFGFQVKAMGCSLSGLLLTAVLITALVYTQAGLPVTPSVMGAFTALVFLGIGSVLLSFIFSKQLVQIMGLLSRTRRHISLHKPHFLLWQKTLWIDNKFSFQTPVPLIYQHNQNSLIVSIRGYTKLGWDIPLWFQNKREAKDMPLSDENQEVVRLDCWKRLHPLYTEIHFMDIR